MVPDRVRRSMFSRVVGSSGLCREVWQSAFIFACRPLVLACLLMVYLLPQIYDGWIPHDQGALAQSAERVLNGELPHRDFRTIYTGGLSYLHALSFLAFGVKMCSMRLVFAIFAFLFAAVFLWLCRKLAAPDLAALCMLTAVAWSLPNYFESMPSWYNLFFATFAIAAIFVFIDTRRLSWLMFAGVLGGLSVLFKVTGFYLIASVLLFLMVFPRPGTQVSYETPTLMRARCSWLSAAAVAVGNVAWIVLVALLVRSQWSISTLMQYLVPACAVCMSATVLTYRHPWCSRESIKQTMCAMLAFVLGVALPVFAYATYFYMNGALFDLLNGVFIAPFVRVATTTYPLPSGAATILLVLATPLLFGAAILDGRADRLATYCLVVVFTLICFLPVYYARDVVFLLTRFMGPGLAIVSACILIHPAANQSDSNISRLSLIMLVSACLPLIQFPFAAPIYFCYVSPIILLLALATLTHSNSKASMLPRTLFSSMLLFGLLILNRFSFFEDPRQYLQDPPRHVLLPSRSGLRVSQHDKKIYESLVHRINALVSEDKPILAMPDCPEVYFLAGRRNPTRTLFEVLGPTVGLIDRRIALIRDLQIPLLVINTEPRHSSTLTDEELQRLSELYSKQDRVERFLLLYR